MSTSKTVKNNNNNLEIKILSLIKQLGGLEACAKIARVTPTQVARWRDGKASPPLFGIAALTRAGGVTVDWLLNDDKELSLTHSSKSTDLDFKDYTLISRFDIEASAGGGTAIDHEYQSGEMAFRTDWLKSRHINPDHASVITVHGDSMEATLKEGDSLLVNTNPALHDSIRDGIYIISLDGLLMVKRLQREDSQTIHILSDNPSYATITVTDPEAKKFRIIGRVVWHGRNV